MIIVKFNGTLLFDEPLNHLDLDSGERFETALHWFNGAVVWLAQFLSVQTETERTGGLGIADSIPGRRRISIRYAQVPVPQVAGDVGEAGGHVAARARAVRTRQGAVHHAAFRTLILDRRRRGGAERRRVDRAATVRRRGCASGAGRSARWLRGPPSRTRSLPGRCGSCGFSLPVPEASGM